MCSEAAAATDFPSEGNAGRRPGPRGCASADGHRSPSLSTNPGPGSGLPGMSTASLHLCVCPPRRGAGVGLSRPVGKQVTRRPLGEVG